MPINWSKIFSSEPEIHNKHHNKTSNQYTEEAVSDAMDEPEDAGGGEDEGGGGEEEGVGGDDLEGGGEESSDSSMGEGSDSSGGGGSMGSTDAPKIPEGDFPTRNINGKNKLNESVSGLLTRVSETLSLYENKESKLEDSEKNVVANLRVLHENIKKLKEVIYSSKAEETMLRYMILVKRYQQIIN